MPKQKEYSGINPAQMGAIIFGFIAVGIAGYYTGLAKNIRQRSFTVQDYTPQNNNYPTGETLPTQAPRTGFKTYIRNRDGNRIRYKILAGHPNIASIEFSFDPSDTGGLTAQTSYLLIQTKQTGCVIDTRGRETSDRAGWIKEFEEKLGVYEFLMESLDNEGYITGEFEMSNGREAGLALNVSWQDEKDKENCITDLKEILKEMKYEVIKQAE